MRARHASSVVTPFRVITPRCDAAMIAFARFSRYATPRRVYVADTRRLRRRFSDAARAERQRILATTTPVTNNGSENGAATPPRHGRWRAPYARRAHMALKVRAMAGMSATFIARRCYKRRGAEEVRRAQRRLCRRTQPADCRCLPLLFMLPPCCCLPIRCRDDSQPLCHFTPCRHAAATPRHADYCRHAYAITMITPP